MSQEAYDIQLPGDTPRARDLLQAIDADYYNVSDAEGTPVASLIVLLDRKRQPVRAELHLSSQATDDIGSAAVRQAQHILEDHYAGPEELPLQVWQSFLRSDTLQVPLPPTNPLADDDQPARRLWPILAIVVTGLVIIAVVWALFFRSDSSTTEPAAEPTAAAETTTDGAAQPTVAPANAGVDLPPSVNADPNLTVGRRVRIKPGLRLTLRSEAGAEAGEAVGFMEDGQEAVIIAGPTLLRGTSDTIVWWFVRLDDDKEAWAAANTSELTLLEPVE